MANLNYLQELAVLLGIGAGAVNFMLNLMVNGKLEDVEAKLEKLDTKLGKRLNDLDTKIGKLDSQLTARMDNLDMKIDKLEAKMDTKIDKLDAKWDTKIDKLDAKMTTLIEGQRRRDLVTVGSSVFISILATSFFRVELR